MMLSNSFSSLFCARASWMPVPHSWYTTNSRIRTPAPMSMRPMPPTTQRQSRDLVFLAPSGLGDPLAPEESAGAGVGVSRSMPPPSTSTTAGYRTPALSPSRPHNYGEQVSWSPSSTSAPRSRCSAASPRSPGSISTWLPARSCCSGARTAPARRRCCGCCAGLRPVSVGRGGGARLRPRPRPAIGASAASVSSATPRRSTTT